MKYYITAELDNEDDALEAAKSMPEGSQAYIRQIIEQSDLEKAINYLRQNPEKLFYAEEILSAIGFDSELILGRTLSNALLEYTCTEPSFSDIFYVKTWGGSTRGKFVSSPTCKGKEMAKTFKNKCGTTDQHCIDTKEKCKFSEEEFVSAPRKKAKTVQKWLEEKL